jgi:hypothetical protein
MTRSDTIRSTLTRALFIICLTPILVLFLSTDARAYIDPSSGSYFFQFLLAGLLGVVFSIKVFWRRITGLFKNPDSGRKGDGKNA